MILEIECMLLVDQFLLHWNKVVKVLKENIPLCWMFVLDVPLIHKNFDSGMQLQLFVGQSEYVSVQDTAGIVVLVHDQGVAPFPEDDGITLMPGKATYLGLQRVMHTKSHSSLIFVLFFCNFIYCTNTIAIVPVLCIIICPNYFPILYH